MRNVSIAAICLSMFAAGWLTRDQPSKTQAATKAEPIVSVNIPEIDIPAITAEPSSEIETQYVTTSGNCADGSCSIVQSASRGQRWTPIRNVSSRWQSRRSSGNRFPILSRLFGRRR